VMISAIAAILMAFIGVPLKVRFYPSDKTLLVNRLSNAHL
jgi:hypothetical protein